MGEPMTGWWRQNALALVLVAVLAPVTAITIFSNEHGPIDSARASTPLTVEPGESMTYGAAVVGPAFGHFVSNPAAPGGTRVVSVAVRIDPGNPALACPQPVLREVDGAQRQWNEASIDLGTSTPERPNFCSTEQVAPYTLMLDYIVPEDASGPFSVDLESASLAPEFARIILEP